jgi:hypothetical protein
MDLHGGMIEAPMGLSLITSVDSGQHNKSMQKLQPFYERRNMRGEKDTREGDI